MTDITDRSRVLRVGTIISELQAERDTITHDMKAGKLTKKTAFDYLQKIDAAILKLRAIY